MIWTPDAGGSPPSIVDAPPVTAPGRIDSSKGVEFQAAEGCVTRHLSSSDSRCSYQPRVRQRSGQTVEDQAHACTWIQGQGKGGLT